MKLLPSLVCIALAAAIFTPSAQAARKKNRAAEPTAPAARDPLAAQGDSPAQRLAPYIENLEQLLALKRRPEMEASFDQASGKLALLKSSFAGSAKTDTAQAAAFTAAATTCDRMVAALDERQQTLSRIQASAAVKGDNDLGRARKDNLAQGINAKGGAKKAAIKGELKRERLQIKEAREEAAIGDDALTAGSVNHWNQRAIELRRQITASYSRISQSGS